MAFATYANIAKAVINNKIGRVELPNMCTFIVTWRCNLRCFMCDVWKKTDHDDMTPDEAKAIFNQMPKLDSLRLTGGEPFLRRDFQELVERMLEVSEPTVLLLDAAIALLVIAVIPFVSDRKAGPSVRRRRAA